MALEPITRQEQIIAGKKLEPITRMERFLRDYGGGSGGGGAQPDWNAMEGEAGHILNRPFYSENGMVDIVPETEIQLENAEGLLFYEVPITVGNNYTVIWNGVEYNCTAVPFEMEGMSFVALGDVGAFAGEPTGSEPFAFAVVPPEMVEVMHGVRAMIMALDGSSTVTLSIKGEGEVVHKMDNKYLDEQYLNGINGIAVVRMMVNNLSLTDNADYDVDGDAIKNAIKAGKSVVLRVVDMNNSDNFSDFQLGGCNNWHKNFYRIYEFGIDWLFVYDNTATFRRKLFSELVSE